MMQTHQSSLLDPSLLVGLTESERNQALAAAATAQRAEERAEQRALAKALQEKEERRKRERMMELVLARQQQEQQQVNLHPELSRHTAGSGQSDSLPAPVYIPKRQRLQDSETNKQTPLSLSNETSTSNKKRLSDLDESLVMNSATVQSKISARSPKDTDSSQLSMMDQPTLSRKERQVIRDTYLGRTATALAVEGLDSSSNVVSALPPNRKARAGTGPGTLNKKVTFKFRWDESDDTFDESDPLYANMLPATASTRASSGNASTDTRNPSMSMEASNSRQYRSYPSSVPGNGRKQDGRYNSSSRFDTIPSSTSSAKDHWEDKNYRNVSNRSGRAIDDVFSLDDDPMTKPIHRMTPRDWRILRENYQITVRGGKAPPPIRSFREQSSPDLPTLHPALLDAIENVLRFREPTPIQRQAITIGLQRRDLIGIAETGSGKTIAFGVPLCHYLLHLPASVLENVAASGPLALAMAPTRELALQINAEFKKLLSCQNMIRSCPIVGGQQIQHQAQELRRGTHIVVGTPGRINECIEMAYLVLNQCCYIVLDEADRMYVFCIS
jgi:hypothetical protein